MKKILENLDADMIPYLIFIGFVLAATGAMQMWLALDFLLD